MAELPAPLHTPEQLAQECRQYYTAIAPAFMALMPTTRNPVAEMPPTEKPRVAVYFDPQVGIDAYAACLERRLELLGIASFRITDFDEAETLSREGQYVVNATNRLHRRRAMPRGAYEIQHLVVHFAMDEFAHIRKSSIAETLVNFESFMAVAGHLDDPVSKATAYAIVVDQLSGLPLRLPEFSLPYETQYFGAGLLPYRSREFVIDAGAADGDSYRKYIVHPHDLLAYHAFEPDDAFFPILNRFVEEHGLKSVITTYKQPLLAAPAVVHVIQRPATGNTMVSEPTSAVEAVEMHATSIDELFQEDAVTLIKMDVEGGELDVLRGAEQTIARTTPNLAVSVYHKVTHLFEAVEFLKSLEVGYSFYLRNHTWAQESDSWPGAFFCETVLYAVKPGTPSLSQILRNMKTSLFRRAQPRTTPDRG